MSLAYALFQDQNPPPAAPGPSYQKSKRIGCITAGNCVADVWQKHFRRNTNYEKRMAKEVGSTNYESRTVSVGAKADGSSHVARFIFQGPFVVAK